MLRSVLLLGVLACSGAPRTSEPAATDPSTLAIRGVTLVDVTTGDTRADTTIVIVGNRIRAVGQRVAVPAGARVVEARGQFAIPGLCDMHVHMFNNSVSVGTDNHESYFPLMLANGVTCGRDMWSDAGDIARAKQWEREIAAGALIGPRLSLASRIVDGPPVNRPNMMLATSPDEGRDAVRSLAAGGAGFIKVYWNLSAETYEAIADEARKQGIAFAGHVPFAVTVRRASEVGQKSIEHLTGMAEGCSSREDDVMRMSSGPERAALVEQSYDAEKCDALAAILARHATWHTPTMVVHRGRLLRDVPLVRDARALRYVNASELEEWRAAKPPNRPLTARQATVAHMLEIVGKLHRAGVPLLAGSDVGNPFVVAGFSLHDELELLVDAGLTPREALATATTMPARYLGVERERGYIATGHLADLVLLEANPLERIAHTRAITAVVANGRYLPRTELDRMLEDVAARVALH